MGNGRDSGAEVTATPGMPVTIGGAATGETPCTRKTHTPTGAPPFPAGPTLENGAWSANPCPAGPLTAGSAGSIRRYPAPLIRYRPRAR